MLIKVLYFILLVALFRFVFRLVRAVLGLTGPASRRQTPRRKPSPPRGKIVDVDFTEHTSTSGRKRER
jgi:hypothetical protein